MRSKSLPLIFHSVRLSSKLMPSIFHGSNCHREGSGIRTDEPSARLCHVSCTLFRSVWKQKLEHNRWKIKLFLESTVRERDLSNSTLLRVHCKNKGVRRVSLGDAFFPFKTSNAISLARVDAKRHLPAMNFDQVTVETHGNVF